MIHEHKLCFPVQINLILWTIVTYIRMMNKLHSPVWTRIWASSAVVPDAWYPQMEQIFPPLRIEGEFGVDEVGSWAPTAPAWACWAANENNDNAWSCARPFRSMLAVHIGDPIEAKINHHADDRSILTQEDKSKRKKETTEKRREKKTERNKENETKCDPIRTHPNEW